MAGRPTPGALLSLLWLLLLTLVMTDGTNAARPPQQLTVLITNAPTSLDPHRASTGSDFQLMGHLYESLVKRERFNPVPGLLSAWESTDQRVWRLHLSSGHWFGNGHPVTARDIAYSLCRWAAVNRGGHGQNLSVRRATVQPDNVVLLELDQPYARITSAFFLIFGVAAPAAFADRSCTPDMPIGLQLTAKPPVGSGPYRLAAHEPGREYRLRTARPIKGVPAATFEEVVLRVEPDGKARVRALADGQADIIEDPPPAPLAYLSGLPHISLTELPTDRTSFLWLNVSGRSPSNPLGRGHPALVDPRVRRALALAINKPLLAQRATDGYGLPANQLGGPGMRGFLPDRPADPYDPVAARELLRAAGYGDGLSLELLTAPSRGSDGGRTADVLAGMLSAAGFKVNVRRVDRDTFRQQVLDGRFDLALGMIGIDDGIVLSGYDAMLRPSPARNPLNPGRYEDAEVTRLLLAAESDPTAIDPAMRDIQAILDRDTPFIPLLHLRDLVLHRSDLIVAPRDASRVLGRNVTMRDGTPVR